MNLGVVLVAGMNDHAQGLSAFVSALCVQRDAQLDPLLSTPDVQAVYAQAQQDAASGACGPAQQPNFMPGPSTAPPSVMGNGPQSLDHECPPGVICDATGERDTTPKSFARFFFNVQLVGGFAYVSSGLTADSRPSPRDIFAPSMTHDQFGNRIDVNGMPDDIETSTFTDHNGDGRVDADDVFSFLVPGVPDDYNGDGVADNRFFYDDRSAWVPDADSFDDYETPDIPRGLTRVPGNCAADGVPSGPLDLENPDGSPRFSRYDASRYCVRVEQPGVVSNLALRVNPGYFLSDSFALSLPVRFQFDAGQGSFAHLLIGLRGELLFSPMTEPTGLPISWFFGATYGQIQAKPPPRDPSRPAPYVISGPFGVHTGINVRLRVHRNFGFIVSPEIDFQFPDMLFNGDLSGGIEAAF
jgi:hypothetical protein